MVTVILGIHGRAGFLDQCLRSVLESTHHWLEVLLVAEPGDVNANRALRSLDERSFSQPGRRILRTSGGDGSSLDTAVAAAQGKYLTFVDADDIVPRMAYARMIKALDESGSDLVVGVRRWTRSRSGSEPTWTRLLFDERQLRQTVDTCPHALVDLALTNKMFRAEAWRAAGFSLSTWNAASSTVAAAYLAARGFDVLPAVVSEVHVRDVSLPIGEQARFDSEVAQAHLTSLREVARAVKQRGTSLERIWLIDAFEHILPPMYIDAVGGREDYFSVLSTVTRELLAEIGPELLTRVSVNSRMMAWTVTHGSLTDVALMQDVLADNPDGLPTEMGTVVLPDELDCRPPDNLCQIEAVDRRLRSTVSDLVDDGPGRLRVDGAAFVGYIVDSSLPAVSLSSGHGDRIPLRIERRSDPAVNEWASRAWEDRSDSAFSGWVATDDLPVSTDGRWQLRLELDSRVATHTVQLANREPAFAAPVQIDRADLAGSVAGVRLRVGGMATVPTARVRLRGPRGVTSFASLPRESGPFTVEMDLRTQLFGEAIRLPTGNYLVEALDARADRIKTAWDDQLIQQSSELVDERSRLTLVDTEEGAGVRVRPSLHADERSALCQRQLVSAAFGPASVVSGMTYDRTVLLEAFRGRSVGDNPGALGRELLSRDPDLDLVWVVEDPSVNVPPGTRAVVRRTREWYALLAHARGYIANAGAPYFFRKSPGQFQLQTWHGTPLKKIGEDRGPGDFNTWRHRRRIAGQAAGWDAMISPSPYCSGIFRSAFGFEGPMLEYGYPRNDILLSERGASVRQQMRAVFGLRNGERAVLYAPTWREYVGVRDAKPLYLDAEALTKALPETVVLIRGHYNSTGQADVFPEHPRIHDVTRYPDIADLYLAADVLITDYSSVMFDFALTDKPIILLTPDLEQYRDVERGFYFDIQQRSPGVVAQSTEEVVDALQEPDACAGPRAAFRDEFCPFEDGHASARIVDHLFGHW